jgi:hypothetical protein
MHGLKTTTVLLAAAAFSTSVLAQVQSSAPVGSHEGHANSGLMQHDSMASSQDAAKASFDLQSMKGMPIKMEKMAAAKGG